MLRLGQESKQFDASMVKDRDLKRKLKVISEVGSSALPEEKLNMYNEIKTKMNKIYSTAKKEKNQVVLTPFSPSSTWR